MLQLNYDKATYAKLSNDSFYFIAYGEEMLDDSHLNEVNELQAKFPLGFEIEQDSWDELDDEDAGFIECTIVPYEESEFCYTHKVNLTNWTEMHVAFNADNTSAHIRWYDIPSMWEQYKGISGRGYFNEEDVEIQTNKFGLDYFRYGHGSIMYIKYLTAF